MKEEHTPGPWELEIDHEEDPADEGKWANEFGLKYCSIESGKGTRHKRELHIFGWMKPSDARLVAAAPLLLEVCKIAHEETRDDDLKELLRVAIIKAEGG